MELRPLATLNLALLFLFLIDKTQVDQSISFVDVVHFHSTECEQSEYPLSLSTRSKIHVENKTLQIYYITEHKVS